MKDIHDSLDTMIQFAEDVASRARINEQRREIWINDGERWRNDGTEMDLKNVIAEAIGAEVRFGRGRPRKDTEHERAKVQQLLEQLKALGWPDVFRKPDDVPDSEWEPEQFTWEEWEQSLPSVSVGTKDVPKGEAKELLTLALDALHIAESAAPGPWYVEEPEYAAPNTQSAALVIQAAEPWRYHKKSGRSFTSVAEVKGGRQRQAWGNAHVMALSRSALPKLAEGMLRIFGVGQKEIEALQQARDAQIKGMYQKGGCDGKADKD